MIIVFCVALVVIGAVGVLAVRDLGQRHERDIARWQSLVTEERQRVSHLIEQMQANAQGMVAAPWMQLPPAPPEPERMLQDPFGYVFGAEAGDDEFAEVAGA